MDATDRANVHDLLEDYATKPVPPEVSVGALKIALINTALAFSLPAFLVGAQLSAVAEPKKIAVAIVIGSLIVAVVGTVVGLVGVRNRLSTYMLLRYSFGPRGAVLVNLCMALSLFGWFGVNVHLFGQAGSELFESLTGIRPQRWIFVLSGGVLMTAGAILGFKSIQRLALYIVPIQLVVLALLMNSIFSGGPQLVTLAPSMPSSLTLGEAISAVVGSFIVAAVVMSDFTRYGKTWRDSAIASFVPYFFAATLSYSVAAFAAILTGQTDVIELMLAVGLGVFALALVIFSSWITNSVNLYGCSLSIAATFPRFGEWQIAIASGIAGTAVAFLGILQHFIDFIFSLSVIFAPVAGIFVTDYFLVHRGQYGREAGSTGSGISYIALLAWALGVGVGYAGAIGFLSFSGIAACDSLLVGALSYWVMTRAGSPRFK